MDLSKRTEENLRIMIEKILEKLKIINTGVVRPEHYSIEQFEEIKDIYQLVMNRDSFSPKEMQAIAEELGSLRKVK
mgnify:CR=1 FL=1